MPKKENACELCHKKLTGIKSRILYKLFNYGITIKICKACYHKAKTRARKTKQKISVVIDLMYKGIFKD